jgi:hypothetical protein
MASRSGNGVGFMVDVVGFYPPRIIFTVEYLVLP